MTTFKDISINEIFYDDITGEYYLKKSDNCSLVYDIAEDCVFEYAHEPVACDFPANHPVETV